MNKPEVSYFDDTPLKNPETQDDLGYSRFAKSLADALGSIHAPNGYVVGLHGKWGAGKSTVLNFVDFYLSKSNRENASDAGPLLRVDFRPWIVSGHDDLVGAYFKVLGDKLESQETKSKGIRGQIKSTGRKIGRWVKRRFQKGDADRTIDTIAKLGLIVDLAGGSGAATAGAIAAKRSLGAAVDKWLDEPSLQAVYEKLVRQLAKRPGKILVFIDDIDRLTSAEIRTIMQMVKSVGRLPNVIYLLSYDRAIVWDALDGIAHRSDDAGYAEKIVQLELELPTPDKNKLLRILDRELGHIIGGTQNSYRWTQLLVEGLHRWITVPRDVVRLANSTRFVWPGLKNEVDSQDLVIMEGMRLFDSKLFAWVRSNRDFILGQGRWQMMLGDEAKAHGQLFLSTLGANRKDRVELLCALFPGLRKHFSNDSFVHDSDDYGSMLLKRRIAVEPAYDAYFSLFPLDDVIARADLDDFVSHAEDEDYLDQVLRRFADRRGNAGHGLVGDLLEQVRYAVKEGSLRPTEALLRALVEVGDRILAVQDNRMTVLGSSAQLAFLTKEVVAGLGEAEALRILTDAFATTDSVAFAADFWVDRGRELGVFKTEGGRREGPFSQASFDALGPSLKALIERKANDGSLSAAPQFFDILRSWAHLDGNPDRARAWLAENVRTDARVLANAALGLLSYSTSDSGERHYNFSRHVSTFHDPSENYYDKDALLDASIKWEAEKSLSADELGRIRALREGLERMAAGLPPSEWLD